MIKGVFAIRTMWRRTAIAAALCAVVGIIIYTVIGKPFASQKLPENRPLSVVALGDSLTVGTGDETGKGYVAYVLETLTRKTDIPATLLANFARNGYTSDQLLSDFAVDEDLRESIREADVVLMTIGGNDLVRPDLALSPEAIRSRFPVTLANIHNILVKIRGINKDAQIYYIGLYNPYDRVEGLEEASQLVSEWDEEMRTMSEAATGVTYVPTFDLFGENMMEYLAIDAYHLNAEGYLLVAERLAGLLIDQFSTG
jgi:lysophospholipase L1-like esterase